MANINFQIQEFLNEISSNFLRLYQLDIMKFLYFIHLRQ